MNLKRTLLRMILLSFIAFIVGYIIGPFIFTEKTDVLFLAITSGYGGALLAILVEPNEKSIEEWRRK